MMQTYTWTPCCCGHSEAWGGHAHLGWPGYGQYPFGPIHVIAAEKPHDTLPFLETIDPRTSPKEIIVGGSSPAAITLEYMSTDGATAPSIEMKTTGSGGTITWTDNSVTAGYHLLPDVYTVQPGTKITIEVKEVVARVRWCETIPG